MNELTRRASKQDRIGRFFLYLFIVYVLAVLSFLVYQEIVRSYQAQERLQEALQSVQEQHILIERYIKCALLIPHDQRTEASIDTCTQGELKLHSTKIGSDKSVQSTATSSQVPYLAPIPEQPKPVNRSAASNKETSDQPENPTPNESYSGMKALKKLIKGVKNVIYP